MAELGVATSGISIASLAQYVGDSVIKPKRLCEAVRSVSEEVRYLVEQIDTLNPMQVVPSQFEVSDEPSLTGGKEDNSKSLQFCQMAKDILTLLRKEAETEINKRGKIGSGNIVFKRHVIEKLRERSMNA